MSSKAVKVTVEVPDGTSEATKEVAQRKAHEAAVLALWEAEQFSTREAAEELGIAYADFLDLLTAKGIPVVRGTFDTEPIEEARRKLAGGRP
jgi:predicted DNA-binding protein (UPF0251 family)